MTVCVGIQYLSLRGQYPVIDVRRVAGPGPYRFGYNLAQDSMVVDVARDATLSRCQMRVTLSTTLNEPKDILAWNLYSNTQMDRVGSAGLGISSSMLISSALRPGQSCGQNTDSIVLRRKLSWPFEWTAFYWFPPRDLWDFWGGCDVTFEWFDDRHGSGLWGDQTPPPSYPGVQLPDGTLMRDGMGNFSVVFGGTDFPVPSGWVQTFEPFAPGVPIPAVTLPPTPVDGTLLQEFFDPRVYVTYGGTKFWITDPPTLTRLGFNFFQVKLLVPGSLSKLPAMPIDGTLLREEHDPRVYLVDGQRLRWVTSPAVMDARCLPWRHVRIVPDKSLAALQKGSDLGLPP